MCLAGASCAAETIDTCIENHPHPPYFYADHDGIIQIELKMAAAKAGLGIAFHSAPSRRCLEEVRIGSSKAMGATAASEPSLQAAEFPQKNGTVDKERAVAVARSVVFRLKTVDTSWNGREFSNLHTRVLIPPGMILFSAKLQKMTVAFDDGANEMEQIGAKLLAGRAEVAIGLENDVNDLRKRPEFAGKIDILPASFTETEYYMVFSKTYYATHKTEADAMWNAIGKVRHSQEFADALRRQDLPVLETITH